MDDLIRRRPLRRHPRNSEPEAGVLGTLPDGVVLRTQLAILVERLAQVLWAPLALLGSVWALAAFEVADLLERDVLRIILALIVMAAVILAALGACRFRWPRRVEALARIDATLPGRPIAALLDEQALGREDPAA